MPSLFLHRSSIVHVCLSIAATTQDPAGRDPHHATQACALNGNPSRDPLICRLVLNPLSHTCQGSISISDETLEDLLSQFVAKLYHSLGILTLAFYCRGFEIFPM